MNNKKLYNMVLPALRTKVSDLKEFGINYISEKDIWNYLVNNVWTEEEKAIDEIVSNILNVPNYLLKDYVISNKKEENKKNDELL